MIADLIFAEVQRIESLVENEPGWSDASRAAALAARRAKMQHHEVDARELFGSKASIASPPQIKKKLEAKPDVMGHSPAEFARWMGKKGLVFEDAKKAMSHHGVDMKDATLKTYLSDGKSGKYGKPAAVTPEQESKVMSILKGTPQAAVLPTAVADPPKPPAQPVETPPAQPSPVVEPPKPPKTVATPKKPDKQVPLTEYKGMKVVPDALAIKGHDLASALWTAESHVDVMGTIAYYEKQRRWGEARKLREAIPKRQEDLKKAQAAVSEWEKQTGLSSVFAYETVAQKAYKPAPGDAGFKPSGILESVARKLSQAEASLQPAPQRVSNPLTPTMSDADISRNIPLDVFREEMKGWLGSFIRKSDDSSAKASPFERYTTADKLKALEMHFNGDMKSPNWSLPAPPYVLKDAWWKVVGKDPRDMTDDELQRTLTDTNVQARLRDLVPEKDRDAWVPKTVNNEISLSSIVNKVNGPERPQMIEYAAQMISDHDTKKHALHYLEVDRRSLRSVEEASHFSDLLEEHSRGMPPAMKYDSDDKKQSIDYDSALSVSRVKMFPYTKNYEIFEVGFLSNWSLAGSGVTAQQIAHAAGESLGVNQGKSFFKPHTIEEDFNSERVKSHLQTMHQKTQEFYRKKLKTQDLSTKPLEIKRGVGGTVSAYVPAPVESWTTDANTPARFGQMMGGDHNGYTILTAKTTYNDILFSYESMKDAPGWPSEGRLKGKKEFVPFGGSLQDLTASVTPPKRFRSRW